MLTPILILLCGLLRSSAVRMDCHPEFDASKEKCEARCCIWDPQNSPEGVPPCYLNEGIGYKLQSTAGDVYNLVRNAGPKNPWGEDIQEIKMSRKNYGKTLNVKIFTDRRYEPPIDFPREGATSSEELVFDTQAINDSFAFTVTRKSTGTVLFDTSIGGLIFSDKFLQIATNLPSDAMYGWGENVHPTLKHNFSRYTTWAMFGRDEATSADGLQTKNLYGVHPFYMVVEKDGKAHGVLFHNTNAQEVKTAPGPTLIYRTIGGILDLYFFPGPTPEEVTQQYLAFIGKPALPAYWALGFQLSRYGYKDLEEMKFIINRNIKAEVPIETVVADIEYMDLRKDFTLGKMWTKLPEYFAEIHKQGMRAIVIYDPAIQVDYDVFKRAMDMDAKFVEWERADQIQNYQENYPHLNNTKIMLGVVWPDYHVAFPDFLDSTGNTEKWWIDEIVRDYKKIGYDGIWIDMNEPANFGTNEEYPWYFDDPNHYNTTPLKCPTGEGEKDAEWDMPPYKTHAVWVHGMNSYLATKTLCMNGVQDGGKLRLYDVKNLYGLSETIATRKAMHELAKTRGVVISRATYPSSGRYAGHWTGDNSATWDDLRSAIIQAQEFNMFGIPYVGSDICGFNGETEEELCLRWHQLGAFHTFMRNHNVIGLETQDPVRWPSVAEATKKAIGFRYKYLPYLFSLHFYASMYGGTVIRPVFYEYPKDSNTYDLSEEFLWGSSMLIIPVYKKGANDVKGYLPEDDWYSVYDYNYGQIINFGEQTLPAETTSLIPVLVRGGSILPRQKPNVTTSYARQNPFELLIAPGAVVRTNGQAEGFFYWDDGESIVESFSSYNYYHWKFNYVTTVKSSELKITTERQATNLNIPTLDVMEVFNLPYEPDFDSFKLNGQKVDIDKSYSSYNKGTKILIVNKANFIDLSAGKETTLSWETVKESPSSTVSQASLFLLTCAIFVAWIL